MMPAREVGRIPKTPLRLSRRSCDAAVADLATGEQLGNGFEIRGAIVRMHRHSGAANDIELIVSQPERPWPGRCVSDRSVG
jgi:hypothetical protein